MSIKVFDTKVVSEELFGQVVHLHIIILELMCHPHNHNLN